MLSVEIQEDVFAVEAKIGPFTTRQAFSCAVGIGLAIAAGCWLWFCFGISLASVPVLIYMIAIPAGLIGFVSPFSMPFERFFPRWFAHEFENQKVCYASSVALLDADDEVLKRERATLKRDSRRNSEAWLWPGCELLRPSEIVYTANPHLLERSNDA